MDLGRTGTARQSCLPRLIGNRSCCPLRLAEWIWSISTTPSPTYETGCQGPKATVFTTSTRGRSRTLGKRFWRPPHHRGSRIWCIQFVCSTRERLLASWCLDLSRTSGPLVDLCWVSLPGMAWALDCIQIARPDESHVGDLGAQGRERLDRLGLEHKFGGGPCVHGSLFTSCRCFCQALSQISLRHCCSSIEAEPGGPVHTGLRGSYFDLNPH